MKKVAILVGSSIFNHHSPLDFCANDLLVMRKVLELSGEYSEILVIENELAEEAKKKIFNFIKDKEMIQDIQEFLFYYTGHGLYDDGNFWYFFKDSEDDQRQKSHLSNRDLDEALRRVPAKLIVKIIDACNSGVSYIKNGDNSQLNSYLKESGQGFENCFFMFSSRYDQKSHGGYYMNVFTSAIIDSIYDCKSDKILFRNISEYVSDCFNNPNSIYYQKQVPRFITQGTLTDIFINDLSKVKIFLHDQLTHKENDKTEKQELLLENLVSERSILQKMSEKSSEYITKEEFSNILEEIKVIAESRDDVGLLKDIFDITILFSTDNCVHRREIGVWLKENLRNEFFAKPIFEEQSFSPYSLMAMERLYLPKPKVRSYCTTYQIDFNVISIDLSSKYESVQSSGFQISFIHSTTEIVFFCATINYKKIGWEEKEASFTKIQSYTYKIKPENDVYQFVKSRIAAFYKSVNEFILKHHED